MPGIRPRSTGSPQRGQVPSGVTVGGVRNLLQCTHQATAPSEQTSVDEVVDTPSTARSCTVDDRTRATTDGAALSRRSVLQGLGALAAGAALAACSSSSRSRRRRRARRRRPPALDVHHARRAIRKPGSLPNPTLPEGTDTLPQIEHIVVLMMENHSYDDHFGMLQPRRRLQARRRRPADRREPVHRRQAAQGVPHAVDVPARRASRPGLERRATPSFNNGRNDGFVDACSGPVAMGYWDETDIPFYYGLARDVPARPTAGSARCSRRPTRTGGSSSPAPRPGSSARAATALVAPPPPNGTIFDRLDAHGITWRNYYNDLPGLAVDPVRRDRRKHPHSIAKAEPVHHRRGRGQAARRSRIVDPNFEHQSEENPQDIRQGERFAAAIINAVMQGPAWAKTLLIWTYDEHGGYYDHVPPPRAIRPDNIPPDIHVPPDLPGAYDRYGFRVPAVIVSPYARANYVSHVVHDHTSVLKLIETKWNLGALTYRDANADNLLDSLDFTVEARVPRAADAARARAARVGRASTRRAAATDHCVEGDPGGPIPPPSAVVPASEAGKLRVGAT